jgi:Beta2-adaptin appendage, C-terminal sub-domain.
MSFSTKLTNNMMAAVDTILDKSAGVLKLAYQAPHESVLPLIYQAVGFILNM